MTSTQPFRCYCRCLTTGERITGHLLAKNSRQTSRTCRASLAQTHHGTADPSGKSTILVPNRRLCGRLEHIRIRRGKACHSHVLNINEINGLDYTATSRLDCQHKPKTCHFNAAWTGFLKNKEYRLFRRPNQG